MLAIVLVVVAAGVRVDRRWQKFLGGGGWLEGEEKETGDDNDVSNSVVVSIVVIFYGFWRRRINMPAMTTKIQWRFGIGGHFACCCCVC